MIRGIVIRPPAQAEIDDHAAYIARENPEAARRFLWAVKETLQKLHDMPTIGPRWLSLNPRLKSTRRHLVTGFRNYIVFYRPIEEGIEVLHVFHGAQDIGIILEQEA